MALRPVHQANKAFSVIAQDEQPCGQATYQTLKIHMQQDRKKGVVLDIADISASITKRFSAVRTNTLELHVKVAPYVAIATAAKAEGILRKEIADVVRDLADGTMAPIGALMVVDGVTTDQGRA